MKEAHECTTSRLLNGIHHIWSDLISSNNKANNEVLEEDDGADAVDGSVERNVEREQCLNILAVEVAMMGVTVSDSRADTGDDDVDKESSTTDVTSNKYGLRKYCLSNPWTEELEKNDKQRYHNAVSANKEAELRLAPQPNKQKPRNRTRSYSPRTRKKAQRSLPYLPR